MRNGFTIIELIFVIVVLGILAGVALPKFGQTAVQAMVASGKADVSAVRSAILAERQKRIIKGDSTYITPANLNAGTGVFGGVLTYSKQDSTAPGKWHLVATTATTSTYNYNIDNVNVVFNYYQVDTTVGATLYKAGTFTCNPGTEATQAEKYCARMIY
ncbi:type II secretion system protein [Sulfurimonas sp. C5]|uniref:type II secretion system protein n=1 Tax=Sulfurimonas sp. C5 TaxID=3036947 RepID=UPI00245816E7|nr:type II secretion system protein [Sulfurimonas sp. C5]MDH4944640.1 type II secretion system protein [Sulfurimonas sp. C5]